MRSEETVAAALQETADLLSEAGIDQAMVDAELLLAHVLGVSRGRVQALAVMRSVISSADRDRVSALTAERADRVPLQHLTGRAPFRGIELEVGPGVFIPRPETEVVAQLAIDALLAVPDPGPIAVDLCTGSGTLALAIAHEVPTAHIWAVERSPEAHAWAERNVSRLGDGKVQLRLGDVTALDPLQHGRPERPPAAWVGELWDMAGRVRVLVSNPPYVPTGMVPRDPEVRDHDPALALYSGEDGLDLIRVISRIGRHLVTEGGLIVLEHAEGQGAAIRALLTADGWRSAATHQDLTMRDRATTALNDSPVGERGSVDQLAGG